VLLAAVQVGAEVLAQVLAGDDAEAASEDLEQDGKDAGHEDDEEVGIAKEGARREIGRPVSLQRALAAYLTPHHGLTGSM
jgi:hypothetical protein